MATKAGTVEIDFAAETAKFTAELKKVQGSLKRLEGNFKAIQKVGNLALNIFSGASLLTFAKNAFIAADAISEAAERAGVAVDSFSRLRFAAQQNDVELEALTTGLRKFQVELSRGAEEANASAGAFAQIGLSAKQLKSLSIEQQLSIVADAFKKIKSPADRVRVAIDLFGRAGEQLIPLLLKGSAGIKELTAEADRLGITMTKTTAAGVDQADLAIKRLKSTISGFTAKFVAGLSITLLGAPDELTALDDKILALQKRRDQLLQGGVGKGTTASSAGKSAIRAEIEKINQEIEKLLSQQRIALGLIIPGKSGGPKSRRPDVNIRSPLQEIDLEQIRALKIPDDPFGTRFDPDIFRAKAQEEFREATLTIAQEVAESQKRIEHQVTNDLEQQLQLRTQLVKQHANAQIEAELAIERQRDATVDAAIGALQAFAGQSKKVAIALVLINKARAISEAIQNTAVAVTAALKLDPTGVLAARVKLMGAVQIAAIAASGFGEIQSINRAGGASIGTPSNPLITNNQAAADQQQGATTQTAIQVIVTGNVGFDQRIIDQIAEGIREATDERDVIIFGPNSRQAQEIVLNG